MALRQYIWVTILCSILILYVRIVKPKRHPLLDQLHKKLSQLHPGLRNVDIYEDSQSHTVNKKKVFVCIRDENGNYYDENMLVYVLCHEYAHVLSSTITQPHAPHDDEFNKWFELLLSRAEKMGLFNPHKPMPNTYCGIHIG
jgi:hypothetical protein